MSTTKASAAKTWRSVAGPLAALRLLGQGAEFVAWVLLARRLGTDDFGRLAVAFLLCRYGGLVADWGASIRGARDVALGETGATSVAALIRLRAVLSVALAFVFVVAASAAGFRDLAPLAIVVIARGCSRDWIALGRERAFAAGTPAAAQGAVTLAAVVALAPTGAPWALALGYGAALLMSLRLNPLPTRSTGGHLRVDGWMLLASCADQVTASLDTVLLALLASSGEAGVYAAVYRLPNAWVAVVGLLVAGMVPVTTRGLRDDPGRLQAIRRRSMRTGSAGALLLVAIAPVAYVAVPALFGSDYETGRVPVVLLLLATAAATAAAPLQPLYLALRLDRRLAAIATGAAALNLVGNLALIPAFGMTGAASATLAAQVAMLVVLLRTGPR